MALLHNRVSNQELKQRLMEESEPRTTISFYRYHTIPDPKAFRDELWNGLNSLKVFGRMHQYYPLVSKDAYSKTTMKSLVKGYFEGSFSNAVSFMVKENNLSVEDLEMLLKQLKKK